MKSKEVLLCKCGCKKEIVIKPHHKYYGIPKHLFRHNPTTEETKKKMSLSHKGKTVGVINGNWSNTPKYSTIHDWIRKYKPKQLVCTSCEEEKKLDLCLLKGKTHERKLDNYIYLCRKCHCKYDGNTGRWKR